MNVISTKLIIPGLGLVPLLFVVLLLPGTFAVGFHVEKSYSSESTPIKRLKRRDASRSDFTGTSYVDVRGDFNRDNRGYIYGDVHGDFRGDNRGYIYGDVHGDFRGDNHRSIYGEIFGEFYGDNRGSIYGDIYGDFHGDNHRSIYGEIFGDFYGDNRGYIYGDIYGDFYGNIRGRISGTIYDKSRRRKLLHTFQREIRQLQSHFKEMSGCTIKGLAYDEQKGKCVVPTAIPSIVASPSSGAGSGYKVSLLHCYWIGSSFNKCDSGHSFGGNANFYLNSTSFSGSQLTIPFITSYAKQPICSVECEDQVAFTRVETEPENHNVIVYLYSASWSSVNTWITVVCHGEMN